MKDLDFDELDRAVSSLMGDKKAPSDPVVPASSSPQVPTGFSVASTSTDSAMPTTPSTPSSQPSRLTPPAARRGGRFMDVVPARKDITSATKPISRQGATLQPSSPVVEPEPVKPTEPTPNVASTSSTLTTDWPDPLELASKGTSTTEASPASATPEPTETTPAQSEVKADVKENTVDEPLSSPFLPDAKVEKRPLGGAALASVETALMVEDENAQLPALPKDVESALHGDVVSIAADNSTTDPSKHKEHDDANSSVKKEETLAPKEVKPVVSVTEAAVPAGSTSISQQYKEEPNTGDAKNGAIYDTDTYHQPLSHPAKKKPGWSWVLWILLILAIGAGSGAALYFLGIF